MYLEYLSCLYPALNIYQLAVSNSFHNCQLAVSSCCPSKMAADCWQPAILSHHLRKNQGFPICAEDKIFLTKSVTIFIRNIGNDSISPDQPPQNVMADQGLHCLLLTQQFLITSTGSKMDVFRMWWLIRVDTVCPSPIHLTGSKTDVFKF